MAFFSFSLSSLLLLANRNHRQSHRCPLCTWKMTSSQRTMMTIWWANDLVDTTDATHGKGKIHDPERKYLLITILNKSAVAFVFAFRWKKLTSSPQYIVIHCCSFSHSYNAFHLVCNMLAVWLSSILRIHSRHAALILSVSWLYTFCIEEKYVELFLLLIYGNWSANR